MDHPMYCAGTCKGTAIQTADGGFLCQDCGLSLEARKARQRSVVFLSTKSATARRDAAMQQHPATQAKLQPPQPPVQPAPPPKARTVPCTTDGCSGVVGRQRWRDGHRHCTRCRPLTIAEVGINKAAPALMLLEQVSPEQVAGGRRRP